MKLNPLILVFTIGASASLLLAEDNKPSAGGPPTPGKPPGQAGPGNSGGPGGQRPAIPIILALDLNKDGVIVAGEITKAAESLKKLDKNGDGKLTEDEYRPQRPGGGPGESGGGRGPGGERPESRGSAGGGAGKGGPQGGGQGGSAGEVRPQRPPLEP